MISPSMVLLVLLLFAGGSWYFTRGRRQQKDPNVLLSRLHPGELKHLDSFIMKETDTFASDLDFWVKSGRYRGLIRKRSNAVCLVQICQLFDNHSLMPAGTVNFLTQRTLLLSFLIGCSIPEAIIRGIYKEMPHFCARTATQLYWEVETRAKTLCREYYELNPTLAAQLTAALYNSTGNLYVDR